MCQPYQYVSLAWFCTGPLLSYDSLPLFLSMLYMTYLFDIQQIESSNKAVLKKR